MNNSNNEQERVLTTRNLTEAMKIITQAAIDEGIITKEQLENSEFSEINKQEKD